MSSHDRGGTTRLARRLVRPHTLVALVALLALGGGSAIAAKKYVVDSKKDIAPKVRKALKGKRGKVGPAGPQGLPGQPGAPGAAGPSHVVFRDFPLEVAPQDSFEFIHVGDVALGPGDWLLEGLVHTGLTETGSGAARLACYLVESTEEKVLDASAARISVDDAEHDLVLQTVVPAGKALRTHGIKCVFSDQGGPGLEVALDGQLTAIRTGHLDAQISDE